MRIAADPRVDTLSIQIQEIIRDCSTNFWYPLDNPVLLGFDIGNDDLIRGLAAELSRRFDNASSPAERRIIQLKTVTLFHGLHLELQEEGDSLDDIINPYDIRVFPQSFDPRDRINSRSIREEGRFRQLPSAQRRLVARLFHGKERPYQVLDDGYYVFSNSHELDGHISRKVLKGTFKTVKPGFCMDLSGNLRPFVKEVINLDSWQEVFDHFIEIEMHRRLANGPLRGRIPTIRMVQNFRKKNGQLRTMIIQDQLRPANAKPDTWREMRHTQLRFAELLNRFHQAGVVHGDLKFQHYFLDPMGHPIFIDLGSTRDKGTLYTLDPDVFGGTYYTRDALEIRSGNIDITDRSAFKIAKQCDIWAWTINFIKKLDRQKMLQALDKFDSSQTPIPPAEIKAYIRNPDVYINHKKSSRTNRVYRFRVAVLWAIEQTLYNSIDDVEICLGDLLLRCLRNSFVKRGPGFTMADVIKHPYWEMADAIDGQAIGRGTARKQRRRKLRQSSR